MASIQRRGPHQYRARVRRNGYPDQIKTFRTQEEAEVWAAEIELEMKKGAFACLKEAQQTSVQKALERYLKEVTPRKRGFKAEGYKINSLMKQPFAQLALTELRGVDLAKWRDEQLKESAANTVRLKLALLSNLYTVAKKEWGMDSLQNPVAALKLPQVRNERERRIFPHEEEKLIELADPEMKLIIKFAIETAARRSEIANLHWKDVRGNVALFRNTKYREETRPVPLSTRALAALPSRGKDGDRVFSLHPDTISHRFAKLAKTLGYEGMVLHSTRHEATSRLFERGLTMPEVMAITGHHTTSQLLRYTHLQVSSLAAKLG